MNNISDMLKVFAMDVIAERASGDRVLVSDG